MVPLHLIGATTQAEAQDALTRSVTAWLAKLGASLPITVDNLLGNVRDNSRYVIVPDAVVLNLERDDDRFWQLTAGQGSYTMAAGEQVKLGKLDVQVRIGVV